MKKTALIIIIITLFTKILGFLRDMTLAYFYGASNISDAFIISNYIPGILLMLVGTGISTTYVSLHNEINIKHGDKRAQKFTNTLINLIIIFCTILLIFGFIYTAEIVKLFASGFESETLRLTINLTRISLVGMYATGVLYVLISYLQIKGYYAVITSISIPLNIILMIMIALSHNNNLMFLGVGNVLATFAQVLYLVPKLKESGFKYSFALDISDKYFKKIIKLSFFSSIGASVNQINVLVDRTIASRISDGGISALNYSDKLIFYIQALFVMSIATILYPTIAKKVAENDFSMIKILISEALISISLLLVPITIGTMLFSNPVIALLFGRGAFDSTAITLTSSALFFYSIGMIGIGFREILSKVFYALQDTKSPMINGTVGVIVNIILNIILSKYLGIGGLALATSISATLTSILLFLNLRKKIGPFGIKQISISFLKILFSSLTMGIFAKLSFNYLTSSLSQNLSLLIAIGIGAVSYFVIIYYMKIEDVDVIVGAIKKKLGRGAA